jgi:hypothetical protein
MCSTVAPSVTEANMANCLFIDCSIRFRHVFGTDHVCTSMMEGSHREQRPPQVNGAFHDWQQQSSRAE